MKNANSGNANNKFDLEQMWHQYQRALKAFLHSKVSNEADVDDLLQDILLKTYQNIESVQQQDSVKSWLFQLAHRTIIDFYRKRARVNRDHDLNAEDLWFSPQAESHEQALSQCIAPFIQALPEENAVLLSAIELNGHSQKQMAEQQGISYSTLKSRVQKSRGELKKMFENCFELTFDNHGRVLDYDQKSKGCHCC